MLVLSRKENESIVIGEGENKITVTVIKTGIFQIRIGIEAPKSMKIVRSELLETKPFTFSDEETEKYQDNPEEL